jgi:hypothetical protein
VPQRLLVKFPKIAIRDIVSNNRDQNRDNRVISTEYRSRRFLTHLFGLSAVTILGHRFKAEDRIDLHRLAALVVLIAIALGRTSLPSRAIPTTAPGTRFCFISRSKKSSICLRPSVQNPASSGATLVSGSDAGSAEQIVFEPLSGQQRGASKLCLASQRSISPGSAARATLPKAPGRSALR